MRGRTLLAWALAGGMVLGGTAAAVRAEESARALLDRVRHLNETTRKWADRRQHLELTIVDRRGGERHRELEILTKKFGDDGTRQLLFFDAPPPVRGTGLLQWNETGRPDRNWLYLPALKRVRQITGATRRESFVGTDFSYEDLGIITELFDWTEKEAASRLRGDEALNGSTCAVIELRPQEADVGYGRIRVWLDRDELVAHKIEFESAGGTLEKTLRLSDIRAVGPIPSAHRLEMRSETAGSRTLVVFTQISYDTGLKDEVFTQRRLERGP